ncbi:unnamed protein product [Nesidiocoris tenuis]|uniref:Uncharacterized protein n=1 Tax=Nesidiocoris tenuis TaxID=355587 RepID=A0A6H5GCQ3_9HEMI|nr:unnamed protein product [Nesidiocoris tenuis]
MGRSRQEYTGHDRFSQHHADRRKKKPVLYQRSASASELQPLAKLFACVSNSKSTPANENEK